MNYVLKFNDMNKMKKWVKSFSNFGQKMTHDLDFFFFSSASFWSYKALALSSSAFLALANSSNSSFYFFGLGTVGCSTLYVHSKVYMFANLRLSSKVAM